MSLEPKLEPSFDFQHNQHRVYTVGEIATALKVSPETIRRKISNNEIEALEISGEPRKQYRILHSELVKWLGEDAVVEIFSQSLPELPRLFQNMSDEEADELINKAKVWARTHSQERKTTGQVLSREALTERFKDNPIVQARNKKS